MPFGISFSRFEYFYTVRHFCRIRHDMCTAVLSEFVPYGTNLSYDRRDRINTIFCRTTQSLIVQIDLKAVLLFFRGGGGWLSHPVGLLGTIKLTIWKSLRKQESRFTRLKQVDRSQTDLPVSDSWTITIISCHLRGWNWNWKWLQRTMTGY
jgi:hypothetical protein